MTKEELLEELMVLDKNIVYGSLEERSHVHIRLWELMPMIIKYLGGNL